MHLKTYLKENSITQAEFSKTTGLHQTTISAYVTDKFIPSGEAMKIIYFATKGEVTPNDLIDFNEEVPHDDRRNDKQSA